MASPKVRLKSKRKIMDRNMIPLKFIPLVLVYLYLLLGNLLMFYSRKT